MVERTGRIHQNRSPFGVGEGCHDKHGITSKEVISVQLHTPISISFSFQDVRPSVLVIRSADFERRRSARHQDAHEVITVRIRVSSAAPPGVLSDFFLTEELQDALLL